MRRAEPFIPVLSGTREIESSIHVPSLNFVFSTVHFFLQSLFLLQAA